jgi:hypothetical protein
MFIIKCKNKMYDKNKNKNNLLERQLNRSRASFLSRDGKKEGEMPIYLIVMDPDFGLGM